MSESLGRNMPLIASASGSSHAVPSGSTPTIACLRETLP